MFERKLYRNDMIQCVLCHNAPCSAACPEADPADLLRSIWFNNEKTAAARYPDGNPCLNCSAPCERACVRSGRVAIREVMLRLHDEVKPELEVALPEDENRLCLIESTPVIQRQSNLADVHWCIRAGCQLLMLLPDG